MTNDVVIVGGGPNGLLLACELALAGVHPIVLERLSEPDTMPKANGLVGRVVQALDYRGLYERFGGRPTPPRPIPSFQFGGLTLNMATLKDHSMYILPIPQQRMEAVLQQRALELSVEIRRGNEVLAVAEDSDQVNIDVRGQHSPYQLITRFLVGADGAHSMVRKQTGIGFPGITNDGVVRVRGRSQFTRRSLYQELASWRWLGSVAYGRLHSTEPKLVSFHTARSNLGCIASLSSSGARRHPRTTVPFPSRSCARQRAG